MDIPWTRASRRRYDASGNILNEDVGLWLKGAIPRVKPRRRRDPRLGYPPPGVIAKHFGQAKYDADPAFAGKKAKPFLVDPTYAIRAVPANAADQVYCSSLAHAAVHGAMAGYTRFIVGDINTRLAMLPLDVVVNRRNVVAIRDRMWTRLTVWKSTSPQATNHPRGVDATFWLPPRRLLFSTGQPPFEAARGEDFDDEYLTRADIMPIGPALLCPFERSMPTLQKPSKPVLVSQNEADARRYCDPEPLYRDETASGGCTVSFGDAPF